MKVDFDCVRLGIAEAYNSLCKEINSKIDADSNIGDWQREGKSFVVGDIYDQMNDLRSYIAVLVCCKDESAGIKSLGVELEVFAPEED